MALYIIHTFCPSFIIHIFRKVSSRNRIKHWWNGTINCLNSLKFRFSYISDLFVSWWFFHCTLQMCLWQLDTFEKAFSKSLLKTFLSRPLKHSTGCSFFKPPHFNFFKKKVLKFKLKVLKPLKAFNRLLILRKTALQRLLLFQMSRLLAI